MSTTLDTEYYVHFMAWLGVSLNPSFGTHAVILFFNPNTHAHPHTYACTNLSQQSDQFFCTQTFAAVRMRLMVEGFKSQLCKIPKLL